VEKKSSPQKILHQYFGYSDFRPGQLPIINSILSGHDTLAIMPTGGGKSICFQVPALALPGVTIVVSPLISLMTDQVLTLQKKGAPATYLSSTLTAKELSHRLARIADGAYKFIYLAPERLAAKNFLSAIKPLQISLLVIDEAHCISQWGHDFRPAYRKISEFAGQLPTKPITAAFTATATKVVQQDIKASLQLTKPQVFISSQVNSHLHLNVHHCGSKGEKELKLMQLLFHYRHQTGIIYTATRKATAYLAKLIKHFDFHQQLPTPNIYHGGLTAKERTRVQDDFLLGKSRLIIATNAFGMGVDKPDIRYVIHFQLPGSLEAYVQEVGRAGRDRNDSWCHLLFHDADITIAKSFISDEEGISQKLNKLKQMIIFGASSSCRHQQISTYFSQSNRQVCRSCDSCYQISISKPKNYQQFLDKLLKFRKVAANHLKLSPTRIITFQVAQYIAFFQPQNEQQLLAIPGIGAGWLAQNKKFLKNVIIHSP
jgi:ATP-dependent DNA helicase RecQ